MGEYPEGQFPSPEQEPILKCDSNIILVSGGEQSGKSYTVAAKLCIHAFRMMTQWAKDAMTAANTEAMMLQAATAMKQNKAVYWLVGEDYEQSRKEFEYIKDVFVNHNLARSDDISMPTRGAWRLQALDGAIEIVTKTAKDIRKLAREAPDGILINEAAQVGWDVYLKCLGRTAPRGTWLLLSGTLESSTDWYSQKMKAWQAPNAEGACSFILPSWSNLSIYPGGRDDPKIKAIEAQLPHDLFMMRFGAVPTPPENLVLPEFDYGIHVREDVEFVKFFEGQGHEPEELRERWPVQLWCDPGYSGSFYAVEVVQIAYPDPHCQQIHVHVIDEMYVKLAQVGEIIEECRTREWFDNLERIVIDVAGTQHQAMPSQAEIWFNETGVPVSYNRVEIEDGILRHRNFLKDPATGEARIFFNPTCSGALGEYGKWLRRKVQGLTNQAPKAQIINCDAMKAINYGLIDNFGFVEYEGEPARLDSPFSF